MERHSCLNNTGNFPKLFLMAQYAIYHIFFRRIRYTNKAKTRNSLLFRNFDVIYQCLPKIFTRSSRASLNAANSDLFLLPVQAWRPPKSNTAKVNGAK
jgi:hypothetical protein